jgi:AmmeMemoRadiSam system protein B
MKIRKPRWADQFYPADSEEAKRMWSGFFEKCTAPRIGEPIRGIQVPHAGWIYSGQAAAEAYNQLKNRDIKSIVMIGPQHHVMVRSIQVYPEGVWNSPLGDLEVDSQVSQRFLEFDPCFQVEISAHQAEHSLEVQIPPLVSVLPHVKIIPILTSPYHSGYIRILADALAEIVGSNPKIAVLVSTDLYHGESYDECRKSDEKTISYVSNIDAEGLQGALGSGEAAACGGDGLVAFLAASPNLGVTRAQLLAAYNSNDVTGMHSGYVVGYSAFAFIGA